jgi:hypothetical protein
MSRETTTRFPRGLNQRVVAAPGHFREILGRDAMLLFAVRANDCGLPTAFVLISQPEPVCPISKLSWVND